MERTIFEAEHDMFRDSFRAFVEREMVPRQEEFEKAGVVDRDIFVQAGSHGFLCPEVETQYGGVGVDDFRYNQVIAEEVSRANLGGAGLAMTLHNDINLPYLTRLATDDQKARWLPGMVSGEIISAIAMTEPSVGSDLAGMRSTAIRDGDHYVLNGSKTFITNGINSDLVIVACKTNPEETHKGMSLLMVERGMDGFERGRNLDKLGQKSQDTAELFFNDVHVPVENLLGDEGMGFNHLVTGLPRERLSIAMVGVASAQAALDWTVDYAKERHAFGQPIGSFQNSKFKLAEAKTEIDIGQAYIDKCVLGLNDGTLNADEAAEAKWWCTEMQKRVVDSCLQLFGGYGYMMEYPIARAYADARIQTIYGGTTEIMKEIIGRGMGF